MKKVENEGNLFVRSYWHRLQYHPFGAYKIENNQIKSLLNKKSPAGLAGYINKDRCLKKSGIRKAVAVLSEFREILDHMTIQEVFPFATASLRNINNAPEVLEAIRENCGFEVRILSGEEEAIFDYYGALPGHGNR